MKVLKEFKEFAVKGNVIDLAVGVVIGAAFGKIVASLVADIIMPFVGLITGGTNLSHLRFVIRPAAAGVPELALTYGMFLQNIVDFLIVAFAIFWLVKSINYLHNSVGGAKKADKPETQQQILGEIRDLLKDKR